MPAHHTARPRPRSPPLRARRPNPPANRSIDGAHDASVPPGGRPTNRSPQTPKPKWPESSVRRRRRPERQQHGLVRFAFIYPLTPQPSPPRCTPQVFPCLQQHPERANVGLLWIEGGSDAAPPLGRRRQQASTQQQIQQHQQQQQAVRPPKSKPRDGSPRHRPVVVVVCRPARGRRREKRRSASSTSNITTRRLPNDDALSLSEASEPLSQAKPSSKNTNHGRCFVVYHHHYIYHFV